MRPLILVLLVAIFFATTRYIKADEVLFDNLAQGTDEISNAFLSDYDEWAATGDQIFIAGDFSIASPSYLESIRWTGAYAGGNMPIDPDNFEILLAQDSFGRPGSDAYVFDVDVTRLDSGFDISAGQDLYLYSATFDPIFWNDPSTYWISIRNRTFGSPDKWFWGGVTFPTGLASSSRKINGAQWSNVSTFEVDFELRGTAVPEPEAGLVFTALAATFLARRTQ